MAKVINLKSRLYVTEKIFFFVSLVITLLLVVAIFFALNSDDHSIFDFTALLFFLFSSIVCTFLASLRIIVAQLSSILINLYFLHRIPLLYFIPDLLDYPSYLLDSQVLIGESAIFFFFFCLALMLGILSGKIFPSSGLIATSNSNDRISSDYCINFFSWVATWSDFLKMSIPLALLLLAIQIFALVWLQIGVTGLVYEDSSHTLILALSHLVRLFLPVGIFCFVLGLLNQDKKLKCQSIILTTICLISFAIIASRATFLNMAIAFYVAVRFLGIENQKKYAIWLIYFVFIAIVLYPIITFSRYILMDQEVTSIINYLLYFNFIENISQRLGVAVESYFLWFKYINIDPQEQLPSIKNLIIEAINSLVPGAIFAEDDLANISKLQVAIGRFDIPYYASNEFLEEIGGGGENPGIFGQTYLLFGALSPCAFFLSGFLATRLEYSNINIFWKYYFVPYLIITPWLIPTYATVQAILMWLSILCFIYLKRNIAPKSSVKSRRNF